MICTEQEVNKISCILPNMTICLASRCMAWEWIDPEEEELFFRPGGRPLKKEEVIYPITGRDESGHWDKRKLGPNRKGTCSLCNKNKIDVNIKNELPTENINKIVEEVVQKLFRLDSIMEYMQKQKKEIVDNEIKKIIYEEIDKVKDSIHNLAKENNLLNE